MTMKLLTMLRKRIYVLIASAIVVFIFYKLLSSSVRDKHIPILRKVFALGGNIVIYGPFVSQEYGTVQSDHSISLVTHTSLKNLYHLQMTLIVWQSPISVAIWTHGDITPLVELAHILTGPCAGHQSISIFIVVPTSVLHTVHINNINYDQILYPTATTCSQRSIHNRLYELRAQQPELNYALSDLPYPNNYLRNIALSRVTTSHSFVVDIDILPSLNLDEIFMNYAHNHPKIAKSRNSALVVPVFESNHVRVNQWTMERLQKEIQANQVRPFYVMLCPQCQGPTQYTSWLERQKKDNDRAVDAHQVPYVPGWEPFIILRTDSHPKYDERFKQFGYNRMSLICELYMSGATFHVLDRMFLIHDGLKVEEGFHAEKDKELNNNANLYQEFIQELTDKYKTKRRC
ncbi:beta-1,4-glucuronyltransferase 1-like isoform X2 [Watersipora subatra]